MIIALAGAFFVIVQHRQLIVCSSSDKTVTAAYTRNMTGAGTNSPLTAVILLRHSRWQQLPQLHEEQLSSSDGIWDITTHWPKMMSSTEL